MAVRQVFGSGISICGSIVLARILSPTDYGVFAIVTFFVSLFGLISDVGLGASLIRQQETPDPKDVAAIFTFQQLMMFVFIAGIWIASPWISSAYNLNSAQTWMIRIMPLNLLWASFQSFANISLERKLHFPALARIEITQTICYNVLAVALAVLDFGAWAFVAATLVRTVIGALGSVWLSRWKPSWNTEFYRLKGRIRFGMMYQGA
ncbi:MAG: oligosaccharide flippase family protein, partial [Fibrobacterota bacterium]